MNTDTIQRRVYNPVQKDYATFIETSRESNGKHSHLLLEVALGGKVNLHRHKTYSETFIVRSGTLNLRLGNRKLVLGEGEKITVPPDTLHAWSNTSKETLVCTVILEPAHEGFEKTLQAGYGLAMDGLTNSKGIPKNPLHLALLLKMSDIQMQGLAGILINALLTPLVWLARRKGVDKDFEKYYLES